MLLRSRPSSYLSKKKPPRSRWWVWAAVLGVPAGILLAEVLLRSVVDTADRDATFARHGNEAEVAAYTLQFQTRAGEPLAGQPQSGQIAVRREPAVGYALVANQQTDFWQLNEQGFRATEPLPLAKPDGELRIFILGGSAAFGYWNADNDATIAVHLEQQLNARLESQQQSPEQFQPQRLPYFIPDKREALEKTPRVQGERARVVNAAVPGYASGNQLAQLALEILPYRPDAVVAIGGFRDLILPADAEMTDIPQLDAYLGNTKQHAQTAIAFSLGQQVRRSYLARAVEFWFLGTELTASGHTLIGAAVEGPTEGSLEDRLPATEAELTARIERYRRHLEQAVRFGASARVPIIAVLQPEISGRGPLEEFSESERAIAEDLGTAYFDRVRRSYPPLAEAANELGNTFPSNITVLNLHDLYADFEEPAFVDAIHLTEAANYRLAERVFETLVGLPPLQLVPRDPYQQ
ncbi:hypothetical protein KR51_00014650 [Rubidibacter lacunae KORDI 51-2]|uniref:GDSL-like Lipase/Acylhydrolase n=1 Tax=Rubidibacter lacunae KORDI 51-2 TaxID=582515 RepID=U5DMT7_9CHRO|nr:hypothetical protein [Rubidibacter lacunae]ERN41929.1 hypothetical protein KR51_00014650 [Rubidibacter lacunae KORDI 51-2]